MAELRELISYIDQHPEIKTKILAFDFAEIAFELTEDRVADIHDFLGGIEQIQAFFIDNNSGEVVDNPTLATGDDRPITRENRVALLQAGMVLDQMIHVFPPLQHIVDIKNAEITDIKASQYADAEITGETFAAVRMLMPSKINNKPIAITSYNGKGVGAVKTLNLTGNFKAAITLQNSNGKEVYLDLIACVGKYIDNSNKIVKSFALPKFYHRTMQNLFFADANMGQTMQAVLINLTLAHKIKSHINAHLVHNKFTTYAVGSSKKPAPTLEEILDTTPRLYGAGIDRLAQISAPHR